MTDPKPKLDPKAKKALDLIDRIGLTVLLIVCGLAGTFFCTIAVYIIIALHQHVTRSR